ncbi:hypothetical protein V2H45_22120 [Tumidithrix elongata RA019]|uniref:Uncharacterized protein n=1 Tax=Tumidithrix elongata BACA0141 TaxID=2716417 RepID=A0AAW9Q678_9CYAN|nr:hypothetical protein [Tumidithrix elongata RA019]
MLSKSMTVEAWQFRQRLQIFLRSPLIYYEDFKHMVSNRKNSFRS